MHKTRGAINHGGTCFELGRKVIELLSAPVNQRVNVQTTDAITLVIDSVTRGEGGKERGMLNKRARSGGEVSLRICRYKRRARTQTNK